jgi:hypothetical protein
VIDIREYHDREGHSPLREWVDRLNAKAARKVTTALYRVGLGNFSNVKGVGSGVLSAGSILDPATGSTLANMASAL